MKVRATLTGSPEFGARPYYSVNLLRQMMLLMRRASISNPPYSPSLPYCIKGMVISVIKGLSLFFLIMADKGIGSRRSH